VTPPLHSYQIFREVLLRTFLVGISRLNCSTPCKRILDSTSIQSTSILLALYNRSLYLALSFLSPLSLALYTSLYCLSLPSPLLSIIRSKLSLSLCFSLALYALLYSVSLPSPSLSILRSILFLSLPPRFLYLAQFCLSPSFLALYISLYSVSFPSLSLSILCSIICLSLLPHSKYFVLCCHSPFSSLSTIRSIMSPFSIALYTSLYSVSLLPTPPPTTHAHTRTHTHTDAHTRMNTISPYANPL